MVDRSGVNHVFDSYGRVDLQAAGRGPTLLRVSSLRYVRSTGTWVELKMLSFQGQNVVRQSADCL